ncbi:hemolysin [Klugiella xanthotipulae]|uniref:23S rRNA (Cytidine1920-2'-O)/16S rRNA (Cytidine1409-2'-O)-methyltransferase n=1 Tax=Klugiella xanthotipulae TaxID=244735 RepID=A0A543I3X8_9MICO|nr:TlyA family RNA methyltransferase [Klugiella xanthotipulae]TQM65288.1 23S rRNA (cytidine1920-2'-O)/16S rRNA (cytidine1409-2'-O)-methyltransferase [Klugiella xanthotipulae]
MTDPRLDMALAERGLARSRTNAQALIAAGSVRVNGVTATKPSLRVSADAVVTVESTDHYVSRAAYKLRAALDAFSSVDPGGRTVMDVGASTGGFSQVLLERGARRVLAIEVGHGQLAPDLIGESRLVLAEGFNARYMTPELLREATGVTEPPTLVVGDLSFISLEMVLPALRVSSASDADFILLIKPQFEVGRGGITAGIVTRAADRAEAIHRVIQAAWRLGLGTAGIIPSPLLGSLGNHEYVVWLSPRVGQNPTEWVQTIMTLTGE